MLSLPKVLGVVFCGLLLIMGLSTVAQTEVFDVHSQGAGEIQPPVGKTIQGEVLRVEGDDCVIKGQDGKEVRLQINLPLMKAANIEPGDRIEAKVNNQNRVLSFRTDGHGSQK
jgi:hypothetical protein